MIHVSRNNQREGPYSEEDVRRRVSNGELALTDLGWRDGLANWTALSKLLAIEVPPPLPAGFASPQTAPSLESSKPPPLRSASPHGKRAIILTFVVCGLGLVGAYWDISASHWITEKLRAGYSDFTSQINSLALYWQVLLGIAALFIPKTWQTEGEQLVNAARTAANILLACGWIGGITAVLFSLRRYVKILALLLMLCGVVPLFFDTKPFGFAGLPMALAGFIGLFARDRRAVR